MWTSQDRRTVATAKAWRYIVGFVRECQHGTRFFYAGEFSHRKSAYG